MALGGAIRRIFPTILLAFGHAACGAGPVADSPRVHVSDSAGIRLVRNLDASADTTGVHVVEDLRIGNVNGPERYQFHNITGVAAEAESRIFVVDQGTQAVRVFDREGRYVRQFGGPGDGPGEFRRAGRLFLHRDTVHVADLQNRFPRGALFDTTGVLLGTYASRLEDGSTVSPAAASVAGWIVYDDSSLARRYRARAGDVTSPLVVLARLDPRRLAAVMASRAAADSILRPIVRYRRFRIFWQLGTEGGSELFPLGNPPFFEPSAGHAIDPRGFVHVAHGWPYVIDTYDASGRLVRRITRAHDSIPVTDALVSEVLRRVRAHYDTAGRRDFSDTYAKRAEYPRIGYLPVTGTIRASAEGWLWVRRLDLEPDPAALEFSQGLPPRPSVWDVFDPDGLLRYSVLLPAAFTLHQVTHDAALGVQRDDLGVQYVVRLAIRRAATGMRRPS